VDGCIPSDLATGSAVEIEEERRLLYVAMTRAKDDLHLIAPLRFYTHGQAARGNRHLYAARSRFMPRQVLQAFEQRVWSPAGAAPTAAQPIPPRDLRASPLRCESRGGFPRRSGSDSLFPRQASGREKMG
jgi:DNA helicase-2/ATP-dependent DNA helicase PcrA